MTGEGVTQLIGIQLAMSATEANELYAELYRVSADWIKQSYPSIGYQRIADLMAELARLGVDGT